MGQYSQQSVRIASRAPFLLMTPPQCPDSLVRANDAHLDRNIRRRLCRALTQAVDAGTRPSSLAMRSMC
jgi:hypothetical protein